MVWLLLLAMGMFAVYQGGMNRLIAQNWGFPGTVLLNGIVFFAASLTFYLAVHWGLISAPVFQSLAPFQKLKWWYLLPGLLGFGFVLGIPLGMSQVGAVLTFLALVVAQILAGASWDYFVEAKAVPWQKAIGIGIALVGVWLASREGH